MVSGRCPSFDELVGRLRHIGKSNLTAFILTEAEPASQLLIRDLRSQHRTVRPLLHMASANPFLSRCRLLDFSRGGDIDAGIAAYLLEGANRYHLLADAVHDPDGIAFDDSKCFSLPLGFFIRKRDSGPCVVAERAVQELEGIPPAVFEAWTDRRNDLVQIPGTHSHWDAALTPFRLYPGRTLRVNQVLRRVRNIAEDGTPEFTEPDHAKSKPIYAGVNLESEELTSKSDRVLGELQIASVTLTGNLVGIQVCRSGNLDDVRGIRPENFGEPIPINLQTKALRWEPKGVSPQAIAGLASLLNITLATLVRNLEDSLLVYPEADDRSSRIWLIDLAPGGSGLAFRFFHHQELLEHALRLGGLLALDCPCEEGFSWTSSRPDVETNPLQDTGCPRCTRSFSAHFENFSHHISKRTTLDWLFEARLLPDTAQEHIHEKYVGVKNLDRISGPDSGSRYAALPLCRKILADRLGLKIEDVDLATCLWLEGAETGCLGQYSGDKLAILKGLREWRMLDVVAHELFHNFQFRVQGLFEQGVLGRQADPAPPMDGKLFIEGSAVWAETHVVDALAIRSALDFANRREGDEYAAGFQLFKWIEEEYGVRGVLDFLSTGDIARATGGSVLDMEDLFRKSHIVDILRAFAARPAAGP